MERFLNEVSRILKQDGYFLFTDFYSKNRIDTVHRQLKNSSLEVLKEERINMNVLKALDIDNQRKLELINQSIPKIINKSFQIFAGLQGTEIYEAFRSGDYDYRSFFLRKRENL